jgi:hypothetical protein
VRDQSGSNLYRQLCIGMKVTCDGASEQNTRRELDVPIIHVHARSIIDLVWRHVTCEISASIDLNCCEPLIVVEKQHEEFIRSDLN